MIKRSVRELVNQVLEEMKVSAVGQSPEPENYSYVRARVQPLLDELDTNRIVSIFIDPNDDDSPDIENYLFNGLVIALMDKSAPLAGGAISPDPDRMGVWQSIKTAASRGSIKEPSVVEWY